MDYMMDISRLILRSFSHSLTEEEQRRLDEWLVASVSHQELYERLRIGEGREERGEFMREINKEQAWKRIKRSIFKGRRRLVRFMTSAAAVLILFVTFVVFYMNEKENFHPKVIIVSNEKNIIAEEKAELIFADGLTIKLDSSSKK